MVAFLVRRTVFGLIVLWFVSLAVFMLFYVAPHDPARLIAGRLASASEVDNIRQNLGLNDPILVQYGHFMWRLLHGDLGYSYYSHAYVNSLITSRLPVDISLAVGSAVIWLILGVGIGVLAARHPRSLADRAATVFVLAGISIPVFVLGLLFIFFLFYQLHLHGIDWFPAGGYVPLTENPLTWAQHLLLPWISLALISAAVYSRLTRGSLLDVLGEDYIRTARAKGLSERRVVYRHALRSAVTPVVTQLGIDVGTLVGGAILTESVFGLNGLGLLAVRSVTTQDLPVIIGTVLIASMAIVVANIVVDALYAVLDPRVRLA